MRWTHGIRARIRLLFHRAAEERMEEEMRFHLEMETKKNIREGMDRTEARRRAVLAFGGVEGHKETMREGRSLAWIGGLSLDLKLGFRMLRKYPGLTVVGGLAIAFAIWVGAGTFEFLTQVVYPSLPLPDGDRIVGVRQWDAAANGARPAELRDFEAWRDGLETVEALGAYRDTEHNLILAGSPVRPVQVAEMTASGFRVAAVAPLLGRTLVREDERTGAPAVVVLGHDLWRRRFGGDADVVGREVRLGRTVHTVVGVMPEGFAFPAYHELWTPLRLSASDHEPGEGPALRVFGRLAPGATLALAQAELAAVGRRAAADLPATHGHLRPQVLPYARTFIDVSGMESVGILSMNLFLVMLLVLVCGNVALLMFARAASRESEMAVRNALGASRRRIILQLFAEALVLAGVAALIGLAATNLGLRWILPALESETSGEFRGLPFWISARLSPATILYAAVLTLVGAAVAGVLPALKVTRSLGSRLRQVSAGGGGYRFGGLWTAVIVAQIAVTVTFPAFAFFLHREAARGQARGVGFPSQEYLSARVEMAGDASAPRPLEDRPRAGTAAPSAESLSELERRLEADPAVLGVTFAEHLPRMNHPDRRIELDAGGAAPPHPEFGYGWMAYTSVAQDYFDVLGVPVLQGRGFHSGDLDPDARVVIVNEAFVERVLGDRNAVGRHVRYQPSGADPADADAEPWYEIVGVVPNLGMSVEEKGIYHPIALGAAARIQMAVHARGDPGSLAPRLRDLAAAVDPSIRLHDVVPLDEANGERLLTASIWMVVLVSAVALLLSLAAIYAVMAFTVTQRTREIGIRVALGADAGRIASAIFRPPLAQVAAGILVGGALVSAFPLMFEMETISARGTLLVAGYAILMLGICLLACVVPTRRALGVEPTEALRAD